jgi:hypothetical protein
MNPSGILLYGENAGGDLVDLWSMGNRRFFVDANGSMYASGAVFATTTVLIAGGYMNFGGVAGIGGYGLRDNAGVIELKNAAGTWDPVATGTLGTGYVSDSGDVMNGGLTVDINSGTALFASSTGDTLATSVVYISTDNTSGSAYALYAGNSGQGSAASFSNTNAANSMPVVSISNAGTGTGAYFDVTNAGNGSSVINISNSGSGALMSGNAVGGGPLLDLEALGADKFQVDNAGMVWASGTVVYDGGYMNFGTTQGALGFGIRDSAGVIQVKNAGGTWDPIATSTVGGGFVDASGDTMTGSLVINAFTATSTLDVYNTGTGRAATLTGSSATFTLYVENNFGAAGGAGIQSVVSGNAVGSGNAGRFMTTGNLNDSSALYAESAGATTTVYAANSSLSSSGGLFGGELSGGIGDFLRFTDGANPKFVVNATGNAYATGTVTSLGFVSSAATPGQTAFVASGGNINGINITNPGTQGTPAQFIITSGGNPNPAVKAQNQGSGRAAYFETLATSATSTVFITTASTSAGGMGLEVAHTGTGGHAARFENTNAANGNSVIYARSAAATSTAYFENTNVAGYGLHALASGTTGRAVYAETTSGGYGVYAWGGGANSVGVYGAGWDKGVSGESTNGAGVFGTTSTGKAVLATVSGSGRAGYFESTNNTNATDTVYITTNSTDAGSSLIGGDHTGTNGMLVNLRTNGSQAFGVNRVGKIIIPSSNVTGTASIPVGNNCFVVNTPVVTGGSTILVTPFGPADTFGGMRVQSVTPATSFQVCTFSGANVAGAPYQFFYLIIN